MLFREEVLVYGRMGNGRLHGPMWKYYSKQNKITKHQYKGGMLENYALYEEEATLLSFLKLFE